MSTQEWTYETLAEADRRTLEEIMLTRKAPDLDALNGYIYCGWNHEWLSRQLSGAKFKKGFAMKDGQRMGYNELVVQDHRGYEGEWEVRMKDGRPIQLGYFRVSNTADEPPERLNRPYQNTGHLNYDVSMNRWYNIFFRPIRDFAVLPNEGDHGLILCKAYLQAARSVNVFYCYFLLGHRLSIEHDPW